MPPPDAGGRRSRRRIPIRFRLGVKLGVLLVGATVITFALLGYVNVHLHQRHLEDTVLEGAQRVSDVIERSTSYCMLRNDREGLYQIINTVSGEPGVVRIRISDYGGRIAYSSHAEEVGTVLDKRSEACLPCHAGGKPPVRLDQQNGLHIFRQASGERVLEIVNPIENQPVCSSAPCHAHSPDMAILGVLDTTLSLSAADADLTETSRQMVTYMLIGVVAICLLSLLFIWRVVHLPIQALKEGTVRLAQGDLGYQIDLRSGDEVGELSASFNKMSSQLRESREESDEWARTLENRVEEKTRELHQAYEHVVHVEKMASIGKLAATVAHEINNPLSGILTYSKLLKKWLEREEWCAEHRGEVRDSLHLIENESRRCGEIVKNLLVFARPAPMNHHWVRLNQVIERCVMLVQHQLDLAGTHLHLDLDNGLPDVSCDVAQIEQVILALVMNATEAMPRGGNLHIRTRTLAEGKEVQIDVKDDGVGIAREVLPKIFEPFFTTKEGSHGVGLGLAISRGIVERHHGRIDVASDPGKGTTFTITLPVNGPKPATSRSGAAAA